MVLSGCSTLSLLTATLQQLNRVFELYLGPWGPGQTGFVALPSHPADSPTILQLQFLFDVLQKTLSLKVVWGYGGCAWRLGAMETGGGVGTQEVCRVEIWVVSEVWGIVLGKGCWGKGDCHASVT